MLEQCGRGTFWLACACYEECSLHAKVEAQERWPDHPHAEHWSLVEVEDTLPNVRWPLENLQPLTCVRCSMQSRSPVARVPPLLLRPMAAHCMLL